VSHCSNRNTRGTHPCGAWLRHDERASFLTFEGDVKYLADLSELQWRILATLEEAGLENLPALATMVADSVRPTLARLER